MTAVLENISNEVYDSWGTLNTAAPPTKLDKKNTPRAQNVFPDERPGSIVTVPGWLQVGTLPSGNSSRFLYTFTKSDGTSVVLCSDNGTVYSTSDFVTFTSIITGLSSAFQLRAITVRNKVWLTNGNDAVRTYDGTTVATLDGTGTTPNVPKGKFIEFWQERIWIGDIPGSRSSVRFTALVDGSGNDIAPDNAAAWPTSNEIKFGQDDGDVICGLKVYRTVLHTFKAKTIYRLDGQDEYTYTPNKTTATTGSRIQESIQERDNLLEFIGKDGVYQFDGVQTEKVSDVIESVDLTQFSFNNIQQSTVQQKARLWSVASDWNAGTLTNVVDTRIADSVIIDNFTYAADFLPPSDPDNPWTRSGNTGSTTESASGGVLSMTTVTSTQVGFPSSGQTFTRNESGLSNAAGTRMKIRCRLTSSNGTYDSIFILIDDGTYNIQLKIFGGVIYVYDTNGAQGNYTMDTTSAYHEYELVVFGTAVTVYVDGTSRLTFTTAGTTLGTKKLQFGMLATHPSGTSITCTGVVDYVATIFDTSGTAQFISEVYHITDTISSWGAFQASYANNGGTTTFYIRGGTSSVNCLAASWTAITPGSTIGLSTTYVYVQFRVDFTPSGISSPELDDATINWNTGSSSVVTTQGVATIVYKQRYWLSGALAGSTYNNVVVIRGKRLYGTPWIKLNQFNIIAFCIFNETLYAAASDSAGLLKLDIGNSANGAALDSYWETRDEVGGGDEIFSKRWPVIMVAGQKKGNYTLSVDVSTDGGVTYPSSLTKTISLSGSGRFQQELRYSTLRSKQLRVRVRTNGIDQPFEVERIQIFWRKSFLR